MNLSSFKQDKLLEEKLIDYAGEEKFKKGLERIRPYFLEFSDLPTQIVTIAGTNGKGQCAYQLSDLLVKSGYNVFTWTSPHILSVRERLRHNGEMILLEDFHYFLEELISEKRLPLSFYESLFWIFLSWVKNKLNSNESSVVAKESRKKTILILEVGLGGRLDAVNLFDANLALIVSIGRDHCEYLGETLEEILAEKWGVVREEQAVLSSLTQRYLLDKTKSFSVRPKTHLDIINRGDIGTHLPYWQRNMYLAALAHQFIVHNSLAPLKKEYWQKLLASPPFLGPGRYQEMTRWGRRFIFIGAHNLDGIRQMVAALGGTSCAPSHDRLSPALLWISFSKRKREEIEAALKALIKAKCLGRKILVTAFEQLHPRAESADVLNGIVKNLCEDFSDELKASHRELKFDPVWDLNIFDQADDQSTILVSGSYYFIACVQEYLLSLDSSERRLPQGESSGL